MRMTSTPEPRLIALVYWIINDPSAPTNPPMTRNTAVKPATNSTAPVTRRHGRSPGSLVRRSGVSSGETGDVSEVAGDHGEHARGEECDQTGHQRQQQGCRQGSAHHGGGEQFTHQAASANTVSMRLSRVVCSAAPVIRAATRPSASRINVVGTALGETLPSMAAIKAPSWSGIEG